MRPSLRLLLPLLLQVLRTLCRPTDEGMTPPFPLLNPLGAQRRKRWLRLSRLLSGVLITEALFSAQEC